MRNEDDWPGRFPDGGCHDRAIDGDALSGLDGNFFAFDLYRAEPLQLIGEVVWLVTHQVAGNEQDPVPAKDANVSGPEITFSIVGILVLLRPVNATSRLRDNRRNRRDRNQRDPEQPSHARHDLLNHESVLEFRLRTRLRAPGNRPVQKLERHRTGFPACRLMLRLRRAGGGA